MKKIIYAVVVFALLWCSASGAETENPTAITQAAYDDAIGFYQDGSYVETPTQGEITARLNVINDDTIAKTVSVILAVYDECETLVDVSWKDVAVKAQDEQQITSDAVTLNAGERLRLFLWENMNPLGTEGDLRVDCSFAELEKAYQAMDEAFIDVFEWLAKIYDPESGGFYTTVSGATYEGFSPSLEATSFVCSMFGNSESGAIDTMPEAIKEKLIRFFLARRNASDGTFCDLGFTRSDYTDRDWIRMQGLCNAAMEILGVEAQAQTETAAISLAAADTPSFCDSPEAMVSYISSLNWQTDSWSAGDLSYEALSYALDVHKDDAALCQEFKDAVKGWLDANQNEGNGYWTNGTEDYGFNAVSGAFKVTNLYMHHFASCIPNPEKVLNSVITTLEQETFPTAACYVRNPISIVQIIKVYKPNLVKEVYRDKEQEFVTKYLKYMEAFFQSDGGASSRIHKSASRFGGIPAGLEFCEGDVDGTGQMWLARKNINDVFDRTLDNTIFESYYADFWQALMDKTTIVKKPYISLGAPVEEDFELESIADVYARNWSSASDGAILTQGEDGSCFTLIDNSAQEAESSKLSFPKLQTSGTVTFRVKFDRDDPYVNKGNDLSYTHLKLSDGTQSMIELHAIEGEENALRLTVVKDYSETNGNSYAPGTSYVTIERGAWVDIKVAFALDNGILQTQYWVNDVHISAWDGMYTNKTCSGIDGFWIATSPGRKSKISVDDIKITGQ